MTRTCCAVFVALALLDPSGLAAQPEVGGKHKLAQADKNYFALRAVADVQRQLVFNPKALSPIGALTDVRLQLAALDTLFVAEDIDADVVRMLRDVNRLVDAYQNYARAIDVIDEAALEQMNRRMGLGERFGVAIAGAVAGAQVNLVYGTAAGFVSGFFMAEAYEGARNHSRASKVGAERWGRIEKARTELETRLAEDFERHRKCALALAEKYKWRAGEVGLDATDEEAAGFYKPVRTRAGGLDAAVLDERLKCLNAWVQRRPRDPFALTERAATAGSREFLRAGTEPDQMRRAAARLAALANECRTALEHIPAGAGYNPHRVTVLLVAGDLINRASSLDVLANGKGLFGSESDHARDGVAVWNECLRLNNKADPNGYIRMRLAFARIHAGQLKAGLALADEIAEPRRTERCPQFALNYARLKALDGGSADALSWLEFAVKTCGVSGAELGADPHFAELKKLFPSRFAALTCKPK